MCGIAGIWSARLTAEEREFRVLDMLEKMADRGPDSHRVVHNGDVSLGFNRLSIVGGAGPLQPLEHASLLCAVNGEIYNYRRLWGSLSTDLCSADSPSHDCAVVAPLAAEKGDSFLAELDGIFAGVTFDSTERILRLFRDQVGVKPMFYTESKDGVAFASTVAGLLPMVEPRIDRRGMRYYLENGYAAASRTLLQGVRAVPPGSMVKFHSPTGTGVVSTWFDTRRPSREVADVRQLVKSAVASEVPHGWPTVSTLSGGIDSSLVTLLLKDLGADPTAVTVRYGDDESDLDLLTARRLCRDRHIDHVEVQVTAEHYLREVLSSWRFDQPISDPNAIALSRICATTRELGSKVLLTGDGADELFGGYGYYRAPALGGLRGRTAAWRFTSMADGTDRAFVRRVTGLPRLRGVRPSFQDPLRQVQEQDMRQWLEPNLLAKSDRFAMAEQVEVRVPFLRPATVSTALSLPTARKVNQSGTKIALKESFLDVLPAYVLQRAKQGFPCPMSDWLRGPMGHELRAEATWAVEGTWNVQAERRLWDEHLSGRRDWGQQLWRLAVARAWWRSVREEHGSAPGAGVLRGRMRAASGGGTTESP